MTPDSRFAVGASTAAFVASQGHLVWMLAPLQPNVLALQFAFTPDAFWQVIAMWGDAGVALYRAHFPFDTVHAFIYGLFGAVVVSRTPLFDGCHRAVRRGALLALPLAGISDLVENAVHFQLLNRPQMGGSLLVAAGACSSSLKWALVTAFAMALAIRIAARLRAEASRMRGPGRTWR